METDLMVIISNVKLACMHVMATYCMGDHISNVAFNCCCLLRRRQELGDLLNIILVENQYRDVGNLALFLCIKSGVYKVTSSL